MDKEIKTSGLHSLQEDTKSVLEDNRKIYTRARADELKQEINIKIESEIELVREYVAIGLWRGALKTLKELMQNPELSSQQKTRVTKLFTEAEMEMKQAKNLHPDEVRRFEQFNLPIDNVT